MAEDRVPEIEIDTLHRNAHQKRCEVNLQPEGNSWMGWLTRDDSLPIQGELVGSPVSGTEHEVIDGLNAILETAEANP